MALKRTVRYQPKRSLIQKYFKNKKIGPYVAFMIYIGYLKFVQKLASEARLNAHEKRTGTILPEHVKEAGKTIFLRLGQQQN